MLDLVQRNWIDQNIETLQGSKSSFVDQKSLSIASTSIVTLSTRTKLHHWSEPDMFHPQFFLNSPKPKKN